MYLVHNLPQLHLHPAIFSPFGFCVFCFRRRRVFRCKRCSKGPRSQSLKQAGLGFALLPLARPQQGALGVRLGQGGPPEDLALRVALRTHHPNVLSVCLVCLADTPHTWEGGPAGSRGGQEPGPALLLGVRAPWWLGQMRAFDVGSVLHRLTGSLITGLTS